MGASASQYDVIPGFDISSLVSATQLQLMQMVSQLAPLSNIGGVIVFSGGGGTDWPGVVNNPRFKRYVWIDTATVPPIAKIYDASGADAYANWTQIALPDGAVTTAKLAALAVTVAKIAVGTARYILRTNVAGTAVEFANP